VEKKEVNANPSSSVSIVYRSDRFALRPDLRATNYGLGSPLAHCTTSETRKNSEIGVKVLVTGGTGFVGSHAVAALQRSGHRLRLLVRDPGKIQRVLEARGIEIDDYVVGDMTDAQAVRTALTGCDAVLHAAATLFGDNEIYAANVQGARNVLGIGFELGIDPILFISTVVAMFPPTGECFAIDDPVRGLKTTYGRSKVESERFARELQAQGAPIVAIYPAGVFGPDDPGPGETTKGLRYGIRFGWPITTGGVSGRGEFRELFRTRRSLRRTDGPTCAALRDARLAAVRNRTTHRHREDDRALRLPDHPRGSRDDDPLRPL